MTNLSTNFYKTIIENRNYSSWKFISNNDGTISQIDILPTESHLFHEDIFQYTSQSTLSHDPIIIVDSPTRRVNSLPGVLILENNNTYGRATKNPNCKKRFYKCIPDNPYLPTFLISYEISIGFSKKFVNKYVTFRFKEWNQKHPVGILTETIGDVNELPAFCEYRLCCRELRYSMSSFTKHVKTIMEKRTLSTESILQNPIYNITNRTDIVIAIDPEGSSDYDDAFSAEITSYGYFVSVYIANVFLWLESLQLWNTMTESCSTIYLPDKRRHMLPPILSNDLFALSSQGDKRLAFTMNLELDNDANIRNVHFENTAIHISKNYVYESAECLTDSTYQLLYKLAKMQNSDIMDSHDVVAHWMIKMNHICGQKLAEKGVGIFRKNGSKCPHTVSIPTSIVSQTTRHVLQSWMTHSSAEYTVMSIAAEEREIQHETMSLTNYVHITSPIRRLVDILNQMWFIWEMGIVEREKCSKMSLEFLEKHVGNICSINKNMRAIKKTQQECETLYKISNSPNDTIYSGIIVEIEENHTCSAYIESLNMIISVDIDSTDIALYTYCNFRVYIFEDEYKIKQKLRWLMV